MSVTPLTILVVNRQGVPSEGSIAWDIDNLDQGYRLIYGHPSHELPNPFGYAESSATLEQLARDSSPSQRNPRPYMTGSGTAVLGGSCSG